MKKVFVFAFGLVMTLGFAQDANAWWWRSVKVECQAKLTTEIGDGPAEVTFEETWTGEKSVCRDGEEWCWSSSCS